jgi:hypothetical protein
MAGLSAGGADDPDAGLAPAQIAVAAMWRDICGLSKSDVAGNIAAGDSFFDVGGSSLKLAEVARLLSEAAGSEVEIKQIVGDPSLEGMAKVLEGAGKESEGNKEIVVGAWKELLNIGADVELTGADTFADHGGHSLKLAQLAGMIGVSVKDIADKQVRHRERKWLLRPDALTLIYHLRLSPA